MAYGKIKADTLVYDNSGSDVEVTLASLGNKAGLASPAFTGTPTAPTAAGDTNTTQIATTAYVQTELGDYLTTALGAPKASPALTGTATAVNLTLSGNLTVNGTTTTVNSTTLAVDDKNIELGTVDTPTDTTADGGGITLKGATDKEIKWVDATDSWTFNQNIEILKGEASNAELFFTADDGDDNADKWKFVAFNDPAATFDLYNYASGSWEKNISCVGNGAVELYHDNAKKFETTAAGVTVTGTVSDSLGDVRSIPPLAKTAAYTPTAADAGKCITTTHGVTIDNVWTAGDALTIINTGSGDITITQGGSFTLTNTSDAATGNRTLAAKGMATIYFNTAATGFISGAGLS